MIPKLLIQTGKDRIPPPKAKAAASSLKLLHPDWGYLYFDDAGIRAFLRTECPEYEPVFDAFPRMIQRIDFFRYLAVHKLGGFYFDLDVFLSEPLDELLQHGCVFPFEELTLSRHLRAVHHMDWEIGNYAFGSEPGHPYLKAAIENCVKGQRDPQWVEPMMRGIPRPFRGEFTVLNTTGPGLLTRTLAEHPKTASDMHVLFPDDVCDPATWHQFGRYGVHLMDGSWRSTRSRIHRRLFYWWEARAKRKLMPESRLAGPRRTRPGICGSMSTEGTLPVNAVA
jgi:hypothetical protein